LSDDLVVRKSGGGAASLAWFVHYLKGEPAATLMTNRESYLGCEKELKKTQGGDRKD